MSPDTLCPRILSVGKDVCKVTLAGVPSSRVFLQLKVLNVEPGISHIAAAPIWVRR